MNYLLLKFYHRLSTEDNLQLHWKELLSRILSSMRFKPFRRSKNLLLFSLFLYFSAFLYADMLLSFFGIAKGEPIYLTVRYIILGLKGFFLVYLLLTNKDRLLQARSFLLIISVYLLTGIVSVLLNDQLFSIVIGLFIRFFSNILPIILVLITASDSEELYETLLSFSYIQVPLVIIFPFSNAYTIAGAYMTYGYAFMIFWGIILLKKDKKFYDYIILLAWIALYVIYANRGVLFCMVGIFIIYLFIFTPLKQRVLFGSSLTTAGIALFIFRDDITSFFEAFLGEQNVASRTMRLILQGGFLSTSGRNIFYSNAINLIKENPFGYGLGFDRLASVEIGMSPVYVHNIFLELLLNYGIILGSIIIVFILGIGARVLLSNKFQDSYRRIFAVLYVMGFIQLLFSSSIFESIYLSTALLVTVIMIGNQKTIQKESENYNNLLHGHSHSKTLYES